MYKVYLISSGNGEYKHFKIGFTKRNVWDRLNELKTANANNLEIVSTFESKWGTKIESNLHRRYKSKQIDGEWFELNEEEVRSFRKDCENIHNMLEIINNENTYIIERGGIK